MSCPSCGAPFCQTVCPNRPPVRTFQPIPAPVALSEHGAVLHTCPDLTAAIRELIAELRALRAAQHIDASPAGGDPNA